ncbi:MAG TPA: SlyX family protein [Devosia sp.]|jgi:SlyX protein|nr:SlyX family protein [Devosia sp.]
MTDTILTDAERLERLETTVAYQDQAIEDLSKTVTAQWAEIAELKRLIGNLGERLRDIADNPVLAEPPEPPPPHY